MASLLHDTPLMQYAYNIRIADRGQSVRYDDSRSIGHQFLNGILYQTFTFRVECRRGLIQNQNRRILQNGSCNTDSLPLASRQLASTVADVGLITLGHLHDEVVRIGYACCMLHLFGRGILFAESDVVEVGIVEEGCFLMDVADPLTLLV